MQTFRIVKDPFGSKWFILNNKKQLISRHRSKADAETAYSKYLTGDRKVPKPKDHVLMF